MSCTEIQSRLTAYLDGELDADRGSAVRGHLRECADCRRVAGDEAALRDGLRTLPPVDPPPSLWAGVQARLAAAEVADANKPAWRRAVARWMPQLAPAQLAAGILAVAAAVTLLWWRTHRAAPVEVAELPRATTPAPVTPPAPPPEHVITPPAATDDVTADLAADATRAAASYAQAADELLALATEARGAWSDDRKALFDTRVSAMRAAIDHAKLGRPRQHAWRELIRYLQGAVVRDDVALAGGAP